LPLLLKLYAFYSKLSIKEKTGAVNSITYQRPAKIVVVDDDVDNALLLRDYLQMSGFDVDVYFSSVEASKNFQCGQYSVAILDVLMDGIGGIELYKIMSIIDNNIRVCFLTGYEIQAADYPDLPENKTKIVLKPVYLTKLLEIIRTLLNDNSEAT
jgi:DNA-binding response OmpR family regulator